MQVNGGLSSPKKVWFKKWVRGLFLLACCVLQPFVMVLRHSYRQFEKNNAGPPYRAIVKIMVVVWLKCLDTWSVLYKTSAKCYLYFHSEFYEVDSVEKYCLVQYDEHARPSFTLCFWVPSQNLPNASPAFCPCPDSGSQTLCSRADSQEALYLLLFSTARYEEEINRRMAAENEFVLLKKVSQIGFEEWKRQLIKMFRELEAWHGHDNLPCLRRTPPKHLLSTVLEKDLSFYPSYSSY